MGIKKEALLMMCITKRYFSIPAYCNMFNFEYGTQFENNILCEQMCSEQKDKKERKK